MSYGTLGHVCQHCGMGHSGACPRVKAIEYFENGLVKRIEYHDQRATWTVPAQAYNTGPYKGESLSGICEMENACEQEEGA